MDMVGGVPIADPETGELTEAKIVTGIDDHSRFVVCARLVARATARPVCDALGVGAGPLWLPRPDFERQRQGVHQPLRPRRRAGAVRPDLPQQRGHPHLDQAAFADHHGQGGALPQDPAGRVLQRQDFCLRSRRPRPPWTPGSTSTTTAGPIRPSARSRLSSVSVLAQGKPGPVETPQVDTAIDPGPVTTRRVGSAGTISFATARYKAGGRWLAGQTVEVVCDGGLVQIFHRGVLVATHARRHPIDKQTAGMARGRTLRPSRPTATAASVTRKVDSAGGVCFAGTNYRVGNNYRRRQVQVAVVGDTVEISIGTELIKLPQGPPRPHPRARSPGQPRRPTPSHQCCLEGFDLSCRYRGQRAPCQAGTGS